MKTQATSSPAELADRTVRLVTYAMFALALLFSLSVAEFFAGESSASIIDFVVKVLGIVILGLMGILYFTKFRSMSPGRCCQYLAEDGFLQTAFKKAIVVSWMMSFLVMALLQTLDKTILVRFPVMPMKIVIQCVLAIMVLIFSVAFLLFTRSSGKDE